MTQGAASVIVVSRHRAAALTRCVVALTQQDHPLFEVIVVADPAAIAAVKVLDLPLKLVSFDEANISAARNAGLQLAAAPVVAFIDDDAVAEPTWLSRLSAPFANAKVVAATGFIRGRNGFSFQWQACEVDAQGFDHLIDITEETLRSGTAERAVKTQGTNCAFRRDALLGIGGFDPGYRFYLDEADVNLRLAAHGLTAIVPQAQVHHGYEASERRAANRVPLSLYDIAASTAIFLRRHAPTSDFSAALQRLSVREAARIATHRRAGRINAEAEFALLSSLTKGWSAGLAHPLALLTPQLPSPPPLLPLPAGPRPGLILAGRIWQKRRLLQQAKSAAQNHILTVICLSPTAKPHKLCFQPEGFWLQTGGLFGQSVRQGPRLRLIRFRHRIATEAARLANFRAIS